jgi:hypothetical protein
VKKQSKGVNIERVKGVGIRDRTRGADRKDKSKG